MPPLPQQLSWPVHLYQWRSKHTEITSILIYKGMFICISDITLCLLGISVCYFICLVFPKLTLFFSKNCFRNTIRVSISLDPDQAQHFVGPDLGLNCW